MFVPSLINPPRILDLDEEVSLTARDRGHGPPRLLLDWGNRDERSELSVAGHVEELLLPLLRGIGEPVALIGYCLGGTMAIAAANIVAVERVVDLRRAVEFRALSRELAPRARRTCGDMRKPAAGSFGALPMEVLQAAFWSLDPERTVNKFAEFARLDPDSADARRFVELEEWANEGEALPYPAAKELIEDLFGEDLPGSGRWQVAAAWSTSSPCRPST